MTVLSGFFLDKVGRFIYTTVIVRIGVVCPYEMKAFTEDR